MKESMPPDGRLRRRVSTLGMSAGLLVLVAIGLAMVLNPLRERRRALAEVRAAGGHYMFKHWEDPALIIPDGTDLDSLAPPGPRWLPDAIRINLLSDVTSLHFQSMPGAPPITDAQIARIDLACLKSESIEFMNAPITDASLDRIAEIEGLETLIISGGQITDVGVAKLTRLKHLKQLWLPQTPGVTDRSLVSFQAMPALENLIVPPSVSDAAEAELKRTRPRITNFHR